MSKMVRKNAYGFYEVINKPTINELKNYYSQKYYQLSQAGYEKTYSPEEVLYINNKLEQKHIVAEQLLSNNANRNFLDIGSGEGWALKFFLKKSWNVLGLDYSNYGCNIHNPDMQEYMIIGDIFDNVSTLTNNQNKFDIILLDNVLEHVIDPFKVLVNCKELINTDGILIIEVPNDFSVLQQILLEQGHILDKYWITLPDHLSYFNLQGLIKICDSAGWNCKYIMSDFPIDLFLLNKNTNYIQNKNIGKNCHNSRIAIENLFHDISPQETIELYKILARMGLGRQIIGYFKLIN